MKYYDGMARKSDLLLLTFQWQMFSLERLEKNMNRLVSITQKFADSMACMFMSIILGGQKFPSTLDRPYTVNHATPCLKINYLTSSAKIPNFTE